MIIYGDKKNKYKKMLEDGQNPNVSLNRSIQPENQVDPSTQGQNNVPPIPAQGVENSVMPESVAILKNEENKELSLMTEEEKNQKVKEYENMLKILRKKEDFKEIYALLEELKQYQPKEKLIQKWMDKARKLESAINKKQNKQKIKQLKIDLPQAFEAENFDAVFNISKELEEITPGNSVSRKYLKKIGREDTLPQIKRPGLWMKIHSLFRSEKNNNDSQEMNPEPVNTSDQEPVQQEGNLFTNLFAKNPQQLNQSIVETIMQKKADQEEEQKKQSQKSFPNNEAKRSGFLWLKFARLFFNLSLSFTVLSGLFLYLQVKDEQNQALGVLGITNQAIQLNQAEEKLERLEEQEAELLEQINLYQAGYQNEYKEIIDKIIANRPDWQDILAKVNEVANEVYELNDFFQYIKFNNFAFNSENSEISLSGTLSDPLHENFGKMIDLEEKFMYHPGSESSDNRVEPYFIDFQPFTNFVKKFDGEKYESNFRLSFKLNPNLMEKNLNN